MEQKGLDFNFFIGMFLIFGLLMWFNVNQMPTEESSSNGTVKLDQKTDLDTSPTDEIQKTTLVSNISKSDITFHELSNERLTLIISNYGASIKEVKLHDYYTYDSLDLKLIDSLDFNFSFFLKKT